MIRVITIDEIDPAITRDLCKVLYTAFGVGTEHKGSVGMPKGQQEPFDANALLDNIAHPTAFEDDKVLYVTTRKLAARKLASGEAPTYGLSRYGAQHCIVSAAHIKGLVDNVDLLARFAMQELGHAFGLHHCLDARCAMYPHWTPGYLAGAASFCVFCREQSEQRIRLTKS